MWFIKLRGPFSILAWNSRSIQPHHVLIPFCYTNVHLGIMFDTRRLKRLFWRFSIKLCGNSKQSRVVPGHHYTSSARWLLFVQRLIFISIDRTFCILNYYYDKNYLINQQKLLVEREREREILSSAAVKFTFACSFWKSAHKSSVYWKELAQGSDAVNKNTSRGATNSKHSI